MSGNVLRRVYGWAAALVMAAVVGASGAGFYVGPDGTPEGDGSRAKPLARVQLGTLTLRPGDVQVGKLTLRPGDEVIFLDGVYTVGDITTWRQPPSKNAAVLDVSPYTGNLREPVTFRAENRHGAILDGGTPITGWKRAPGPDPVWEARLPFKPPRIMVNTEMLLECGVQGAPNELVEGTYKVLPAPDGAGVVIQVRPWLGEEPKEAYAPYLDCVLLAGGNYVVVDGFVVRRGLNGMGLGGRHQTIRNCIIRDHAGQGIAGGGRGFNTMEDCVIYNCGTGQGDHGIYTSGQSHRLTLRRNVWWRISGGAIHIYSGGEGIDEPARIAVEYNLIGPDKLGRCWPRLLENRKSAGIYVYGGSRWAGYNRITNNVIFGGHARAISQNRSHFNLIANNVLVDCDEYDILLANGMGNLVVNNIMEPGRNGYVQIWDSQLRLQSGHNLFVAAPEPAKKPLWQVGGEQNPVDFTDLAALVLAHANLESGSVVSAEDPFVDRARFDFRLKPGSKAVDMGEKLHHLSDNMQGQAPDAGALELGEEMSGEKGKFPEIPAWLLEEWPLSKRREQEKNLK